MTEDELYKHYKASKEQLELLRGHAKYRKEAVKTAKRDLKAARKELEAAEKTHEKICNLWVKAYSVSRQADKLFKGGDKQ